MTVGVSTVQAVLPFVDDWLDVAGLLAAPVGVLIGLAWIRVTR